jgi:hypothetical protein
VQTARFQHCSEPRRAEFSIQPLVAQTGLTASGDLTCVGADRTWIKCQPLSSTRPATLACARPLNSGVRGRPTSQGLKLKLLPKGIDDTVATPKGMRVQTFPVNASDAVHVYSDETHIWIQLRRDVPTEQDIGRSSFKVAFCLTPGTAHKVGLELMNVAEKNKEKQKAKAVTATKAAKPKGSA